jgi:hypothetical protein
VVLCPSLVAVIVAEPTATAVTSPVVDTVATLVFDVAHVTVRPVNAVPDASVSPALSCCVSPDASIAVAGDTATVATGRGVTVTATAADFPSIAAVIVAVRVAPPRYATAVTNPVLETVATVASDDVHATGRPVRAVPDVSVSTALSCCEFPGARVTIAGVTTTDPTGRGVTVTVTVADLPSLVAEIFAVRVSLPK